MLRRGESASREFISFRVRIFRQAQPSFAQTSAPEDFSRRRVLLEAERLTAEFIVARLTFSPLKSVWRCGTAFLRKSQTKVVSTLASRGASRGCALTNLPVAGVAYTKCTNCTSYNKLGGATFQSLPKYVSGATAQIFFSNLNNAPEAAAQIPRLINAFAVHIGLLTGSDIEQFAFTHQTTGELRLPPAIWFAIVSLVSL